MAPQCRIEASPKSIDIEKCTSVSNESDTVTITLNQLEDQAHYQKVIVEAKVIKIEISTQHTT